MQKIKILVVDDEEANLRLLEYSLTPHNYKVDKASCAKDAIDLFISNDYDIVLLDIMMPMIDGIEACRIMSNYKKNVPIILLTALTDPAVLKKGFEAGAWDYITKPWTEIELISRIDKAKKLYDAEKQVRNLYEQLKNESDILTKEMCLAIDVQNYLLPPWMIFEKTLYISSTYKPSVSLGGDIFDFLPLDNNKYIVYIADVAGHGVQAALMMSAVKAIVRMIADEEKDTLSLSSIASRLNKVLAKNIFFNKFMTFLIMEFDLKDKKMTFYNAGHPPFLIINKRSKEIRKASDLGVYPIGWDEKLQYLKSYEKTIDLSEDDVYLFYTDGVTESPQPDGSFLTTDGLINLLNTYVNLDDIPTVPYQVKQKMKELKYNINYDDFTIFCVCPICRKSIDKIVNISINLDNFDFNNTKKQLIEAFSDQASDNNLILFYSFINMLYAILKGEVNNILFDNTLTLIIRKEDDYHLASCFFKFTNNVQNEAILHTNMTELINDPLFISGVSIELQIYDDLVGLLCKIMKQD